MSAGEGVGGGKGGRRATRAAVMRNRRASREYDEDGSEDGSEEIEADDEDSDDDDDDDEADADDEIKPGRSPRSAPPVCPNEFLYASPEMRLASGDPRQVDIRRHECFGLGVLMVELCWPEVAAGAMGDVAKLLGATLRPDGVGAAALDADPNESAVARQLLQPVPANRPSAKQVTELIKRAAEIAEAEADGKDDADVLHRENGWPTRREMGLATERRLTELVTLRTFLIAHKEARLREVQGHKVRSALLAHALRQLGEQTEVGADDGIGQRGGSAGNLRRASFNRGQSPPPAQLRRLSTHPPRSVAGHTPAAELQPRSRPADAGAGRGPRPPVQAATDEETAAIAGRHGDFPGPGWRSARHARGRPATFLHQRGRRTVPAHQRRRPSERRLPTPVHRAQEVVRRQGVAATAGSPRANAGRPTRVPSPCAATAPAPASTPPDPTTTDNGAPACAVRLSTAVSAPGTSSGWAAAVRGRADAAAAVAKSHRVAKELDEAEFEALEENFFDACARAIAPIARNYTKAQVAIAIAGGSSGEGSPDGGSPDEASPEEGEPTRPPTRMPTRMRNARPSRSVARARSPRRRPRRRRRSARRSTPLAGTSRRRRARRRCEQSPTCLWATCTLSGR